MRYDYLFQLYNNNENVTGMPEKSLDFQIHKVDPPYLVTILKALMINRVP